MGENYLHAVSVARFQTLILCECLRRQSFLELRLHGAGPRVAIVPGPDLTLRCYKDGMAMRENREEVVRRNGEDGDVVRG